MNKYKTVDEFLADLDDTQRSQVQKLREYILETDNSLAEHIKWNAPSYIKNDEDRITFNLMNKEHVVKLVFHMGATRKEDKSAEPILKNAQLLEWASNIRGYATFDSIEEIKSSKEMIKQLVQTWLALS